MSEVKWIKITTDIFDDEKILLIESLPDADSISVIWFKLLCLAGKMNNSGVFVMNDTVAYTDSMLSTIFRRKENTVKLALDTFERFGMIKRIGGAITIPNWGKHQNMDQLEKKKEYQRNYMRNYREKQRGIVDKSNCKTNSNTNVSFLDKERDIDKEKNNNYSVHFESFWNAYPRKKEKAKAYKCYNARLKEGYSEEELLTAAVEYAKECKERKTEERYIKLGSTFLSASTPFTDYLKKEGDKSETEEHRGPAADMYREYLS